MKKKILNTAQNIFYLLIIFIITLGFGGLSLAKQISAQQLGSIPIIATVSKEKITFTSAVAGTIVDIPVAIGEKISADQVVVQLSDPSLAAKRETLLAVAEENLSAKTELSVLDAQLALYQVKTPRSGSIADVFAARGQYVTQSQPLLSMYADDGIHLFTQVGQDEYHRITKEVGLHVLNPRTKTALPIQLKGVNRVIQKEEDEEAKFELLLSFSDEGLGGAFIEGEQLQIMFAEGSNKHDQPAFRLASLWSSFLDKTSQ